LLTDNQLPPWVTVAAAAGSVGFGGTIETLKFWKAGGGEPVVAENESAVGLTAIDEGTTVTVRVTGSVNGLLDTGFVKGLPGKPGTTTAIDPE
jgi:hypothetical protein